MSETSISDAAEWLVVAVQDAIEAAEAIKASASTLAKRVEGSSLATTFQHAITSNLSAFEVDGFAMETCSATFDELLRDAQDVQVLVEVIEGERPMTEKHSVRAE